MVILKNDYERVALGGLLHDIGKLFNRSDFYREKGVSGEHPFLSSWFVDYIVENKIILNDEALKEITQKHHESQYFPKELNVSSIKDTNLKKLALIVAKADNYSSMERHGEDKTRSYKNVPLDSIFSRIDIGKGKAPTTRYYLREFHKEHLFSKTHEANSQSEVNDIIEKLLSEVREIKTDSFQVLYLRVLEIIKKYVWTLPSDTQKEICDLSLYDHLKTTSAISIASYNYHIEKIFINSDDTLKRILRVSSDHNNEYGITLDKSEELKDGDILLNDGKNLVVIKVKGDDVLVIKPNDITEMGIIAHSLGNRHLQAQFNDGKMIIQYDALVEEELKRDKINYSRENLKLEKAFRHVEFGHTHTHTHAHAN